MRNSPSDKPKLVSRSLLNTTTIAGISALVIAITVIGVWFLGIEKHRSWFTNAMMSLSWCALAFFLFLTFGLYYGVKLKDNIGRITDRIRILKSPQINRIDIDGDFSGIGDDALSMLIGFVLWIVVGAVLTLLLALLSSLLWAGILIFMAMLYWVFFRALRVVFKHAKSCKGNILRSVAYGLIYTTGYVAWMYGVFAAIHAWHA